MAKFVIAGKSNCPYYAKAELLGDELAKNLPDFRVHKIVKDPSEWDEWLREVCKRNNWKHTKSPIVWRELVDRGGKGMLLGDANDFQEYAKGYYGIKSKLVSTDLKKICYENDQTYKIVQDEIRKEQAKIKPINVTISNPDTSVVYFIMNELLSGKLFGMANEIFIRLYCEHNSPQLEGLRMEIEDLASQKLLNIKICHKKVEAFTNCDFAILFDELQTVGHDSDRDNTYLNPYISLANVIDEVAKKTCKILITPFESRSEIYALVNVVSKHLKRIDAKTNLIGNSMCDEMLAKSILAQRLKVNPAYLKDVILFGQSISDSYFLDISRAKVTDFDGAVWARKYTHWLSVVNQVADRDWMHKDFLTLLKEREKTVREKLGRNGTFLFAQSVIQLIKLWNRIEVDPLDDGLHSAVVYANDAFSIKEDIFISLPVHFENGSFHVSDNFKLNSQKQAYLTDIIKDTKKKIGHRYKDDVYVKDTQEWKLSIPSITIE